MNLAPLLDTLRSRDVRLWAEGDRLRCDGPPGALTPELREQLLAAKPELLEFLHAARQLVAQLEALVPLTPRSARSERPVLFGIGGHNGDVFCFRELARHLGSAQPFYGLQPPGADGRGEPLARVEDLAAHFLEQIRSFQPDGPYHLVGYCAGGAIAFELAQQLRAAGAHVALLALIGSPHPHQFRPWFKLQRQLQQQWERMAKHAAGLGRGDWSSRRRYWHEALRERRERYAEETLTARDPALAARARLEDITLRGLARYEVQTYPDRLMLFLPNPGWMGRGGLAARWSAAAARVEEHYGPDGSDGDTMLRTPHAGAFAPIFRRCLDDVYRAEGVPKETPKEAKKEAPTDIAEAQSAVCCHG